MALTEAEKRQRLRERRAAKVANTNARLQKITGDPTSTPSPEPTSSTSSGASTPLQEPPIAKSNAPRSRISQNFGHVNSVSAQEDDTDDPPIQDIDELGEADDFQRALNKVLADDKHKHEGRTEMGEFDMMAQLLGMDPSKMPQQSGQDPILAMLQQAGMAQEGGVPGIFGMEKEPGLTAGEVVVEKQKSDKFKAKFMLFKLVFNLLLAVYFFLFEGHHSSLAELQRSYRTSLFTQLFAAFEVGSIGYYASVLHRLPDAHYNYDSKILDYMGFVPDVILPAVWKGRIKLGIKYLELFQLVLFDISTLVIVFGLLAFLH